MELYNMKQVSQMIGADYQRIKRIVELGRVECYQAGRSRLFTREHIDGIKEYFVAYAARVKTNKEERERKSKKVK